MWKGKVIDPTDFRLETRAITHHLGGRDHLRQPPIRIVEPILLYHCETRVKRKARRRDVNLWDMGRERPVP
jgi:hypothetical protein